MKLYELFFDMESDKIFVPLDKGKILCQIPQYMWLKVEKEMPFYGIKGQILPPTQQRCNELYNNVTESDRFVWLSKKYEPNSKSYKIDLSKLNNQALRALSWDDKYVLYRGEIPFDAIASRRGFGAITERKILEYRYTQILKYGPYWFKFDDNSLTKVDSHSGAIAKHPEKFGVTLPPNFHYEHGTEYPELIAQAIQHDWVRVMLMSDEVNIETINLQIARKTFMVLNQPAETFNIDINNGSTTETHILRGKRLELFLKTGNIPPQRGLF